MRSEVTGTAGQSRAAGRGRDAAIDAAIALVAVLLFHLVSLASGKLDVSGGLGWDGEGYARMATQALTEGTANTQARPLLPLLVRVPYSLGLSVIASFELLNYLSAFVLYLTAALMLRRTGATAFVRTVVVANLALCIATSKMFAFYPVQIDFGAIALTTLAFHLVRADRRWLGGAACVLAAASREFGAAAAIYALHRGVRQRRPALETIATSGPALATAAAIRWWVMETSPDSRGPLTIGSAIGNLEFWLTPAFVAAFLYFAIVLFGGISALLAARARWCLERIRREPEIATYLLVLVALTAAGSLDIWRYLAFTLPAALTLAGLYLADLDSAERLRALTAVTLITVVTQRPFELMNTTLYFRDWFPLYRYFDGTASDLASVWIVRLASVALLLAALSMTAARWRPARASA